METTGAVSKRIVPVVLMAIGGLFNLVPIAIGLLGVRSLILGSVADGMALLIAAAVIRLALWPLTTWITVVIARLTVSQGSASR